MKVDISMCHCSLQSRQRPLAAKLGRAMLLFHSVVLLCLVQSAFAQFSTNTIIKTNSTWRFLRGTNEASIPMDAWRFLSFNDSAWEARPAPFHYGTNSGGGDDDLTGGTILSDMLNNYGCIFIRQKFVITNAYTVIGINTR